MIGPGHCKPQALIFNGSLDEPPADNIESDCTTVPEVSVEPKVTRASTEAAAIEGTGTGATAAEYSLYPPERLRTFLYPFPSGYAVPDIHANLQHKTIQWACQ